MMPVDPAVPVVSDAKPKSCCAPAAVHEEPVVAVVASEAREPEGDVVGRMIALPGGRFLMGTHDPEGFPGDGEGPVREVTVAPFAIDRAPVTNALFARFIAATGYVTEGERYGWSFVFAGLIPKKRFAELVEDTVRDAPWWCRVSGATWRTPEGPQSDLRSREDHPVVQVSWTDAQAFCRWSGQRLPTEAEWEYAGRGGLEQNIYPWGDKLRPGGEHRCNIWQGVFPTEDTGDDGYKGTCPVEAFPANGFGLYSVAGNTWEWCADWFSRDFHRTAGRENPLGPTEGTGRVIRGGSFLCHKSYCNRYRVAARSSNTPDSTTSNISFRCVRSL